MIIQYKGHEINVNEHLLDENNAWANLKGILETRIRIKNILYEEAAIKKEDFTNEKAKEILDELTDAEYDLQMYWEFPEDSRFHTYHQYLTKCTCPKTDNQELLGTNKRWVSGGCPYHCNFGA